MEIKRRKKIVFTTERKVMVRCGNNPTRLDCIQCDGLMISTEDAATAGGQSPREIYRRIEAGTIWFVETPDKRIFVCQNCDAPTQQFFFAK